MQSPTDTLWHWFYTNAPAAWFSAVAATVTLIYVLRTRKKPRRLVVRETAKSSLVRIWPSIREKIGITFDGRSIDTLGQIDLEILNEGSDTIQQPEITLTLPAETRVLDAHAIPEDLLAVCQIHPSKVIVKLPYLNPFRDHRQTVTLSILVEGPTGPVKATGGGEGWSLLHKRLPSKWQSFLNEAKGPLVFWVYMLSALLYKDWAWTKFGIAARKFVWRDLYILSPIIFVASGLVAWGIRSINNEAGRRPTGWKVD